MMKDEDTEQMRAKLLAAVADQAKPVDFDALVAAGVLKRLSANRYEVLRAADLPKYASAQATSALLKPKPDGSQVQILTFRNQKTAAKQAEKYRNVLASAVTPKRKKGR
jgi:hypothetical protein